MLGFFLWRWSILIDIRLIYIYIYIYILAYFWCTNKQLSNFNHGYQTWDFSNQRKRGFYLDLQISIRKNSPHFSGGEKSQGNSDFWILLLVTALSGIFLSLSILCLRRFLGPPAQVMESEKNSKVQVRWPWGFEKVGSSAGKKPRKGEYSRFFRFGDRLIDRNLLQNGNFRNYTIQSIEWFFLQDFPALKPPWNGWHDRVLGWKNQNGVRQYFICK